MPRVACVQFTATSDIEGNLATVDRLGREATGVGASCVATPENTTYLGPHDRKAAIAEPLDGPIHRRLGALAGELGITLLVGSVVEASPDAARPYNTSVLFGPDGGRLAAYRKLHLFDVDLRDAGGPRFTESERTSPGESVVVCDTELGRLGLTVCYDLRFPELYRALRERGAEILTVPAAFTVPTGRAHWHVLLRARAIETQCWVLAPAQCGRHDDGGLRESYGHALIVDPWGEVVAECGAREGVCYAELDTKQVYDIRRRIPVAAHRRLPPRG